MTAPTEPSGTQWGPSRFSWLGTQIFGKRSSSSNCRISCASLGDPFSACAGAGANLGRVSNSQRKLQLARSRSNQRTCPLATMPTRAAIPARPEHDKTSPPRRDVPDVLPGRRNSYRNLVSSAADISISDPGTSARRGNAESPHGAEIGDLNANSGDECFPMSPWSAIGKLTSGLSGLPVIQEFLRSIHRSRLMRSQ